MTIDFGEGSENLWSSDVLANKIPMKFMSFFTALVLKLSYLWSQEELDGLPQHKSYYFLAMLHAEHVSRAIGAL